MRVPYLYTLGFLFLKRKEKIMLIKNLKSATKSFEKMSIPGKLGVSDIKFISK